MSKGIQKDSAEVGRGPVEDRGRGDKRRKCSGDASSSPTSIRAEIEHMAQGYGPQVGGLQERGFHPLVSKGSSSAGAKEKLAPPSA